MLIASLNALNFTCYIATNCCCLEKNLVHYVAQVCKKLKRKKTYVQKIGKEKEDPMTLMLSQAHGQGPLPKLDHLFDCCLVEPLFW